MLKLKVNLGNLKSSILAESDSALSKELVAIANAALDELIEATPIDTGRARRGWSVRFSGDKAILENDVAYVKLLNQGTSQQAPAYFIESIVLKYGKPSGSVVTYT